MSGFRSISAAVAVATLIVTSGLAQEKPPDPQRVRPTVKQITLFKNGLAYVELEVKVPKNDGWVQVIPPSLPLHGSYWVAYDPAQLAVKESVAERVKIAEEIPADSIPALLRANVGRDMILKAGDQEFGGTLISYPGTEAAGAPHSTWPGEEIPEPQPGTLVLLKTYRGTVALNPASVTQVVFEGAVAAADKVARTRDENRLRVRVEKAAEGATFVVQYLTHGVAWAPSYRLDLSDDGKAVLQARTDVLDDAMDLEGVPTTLVSGFPNLRFVHVPGALAMQTRLDEFTQLLAQEPQQPMRREQVMQQSVYSNASFASEQGLAEVTTQGFTGEAREDMFLSVLGPVTLKKGGRGNYPLFSAEVPCEQVFRWEIADYMNAQGYYQQREERTQPEEVWHSLRVSNVTNSPWTTAPVTVMKGGAVLGQDVCFYTPAGGKSLVKVTKALNIRAEQQEHEVERKREAERLYGSDYDLVTIEGTLYLCSYKPHDVTVEISKTLSGDLQKADENPNVVKLGRGLLQVNPVNRINWRLTLAAGKELKVGYTYKVLVRR